MKEQITYTFSTGITKLRITSINSKRIQVEFHLNSAIKLIIIISITRNNITEYILWSMIYAHYTLFVNRQRPI